VVANQPLNKRSNSEYKSTSCFQPHTKSNSGPPDREMFETFEALSRPNFPGKWFHNLKKLLMGENIPPLLICIIGSTHQELYGSENKKEKR